jgi:hypothetical protein
MLNSLWPLKGLILPLLIIASCVGAPFAWGHGAHLGVVLPYFEEISKELSLGDFMPITLKVTSKDKRLKGRIVETSIEILGRALPPAMVRQAYSLTFIGDAAKNSFMVR